MFSEASTTEHAVRGQAPRTFLMPTTARAAAAAAVTLAVYALLVLFRWPSTGFVAAVTDIAFPLMSMVNVGLSALAAGRAHGRLRLAWAALTLGLVAEAFGELLWTYYEHVVGYMPFPAWDDVGYLASIPLVSLALLLIPSPRTWREHGRLVLDGLIVTGSLFLISWVAVMHTVWQEAHDSNLVFALKVAYPAGDVLVVTMGLLVLFRAPAGLRPTVGLLVAGLACSAAGNILWAYLGDPADYKNGGVADIFYAANYLLIGVALVAAQNAEPGAVAATAPPGWVSLWLPLVPVAVAAVFVATAKQSVVMAPVVIVAGTIVVVATLFRQFLESAELVQREHLIRHLADQLTGELDSASRYVASILPGELDGPVHISSRYTAAQAVGGDSFGYDWIDDDHLNVYLVDVSGHGVKPALLSVSVHNLLRSGGLGVEVLLAPDRVLGELNARFNMDDHDGHYFTMWYGVYRLSTRTLRYANAGHPPPLILTGAGGVVGCVPLGGRSMPAGMFDDTEFLAEDCVIPAGAMLLLYSDGVLGDPPQTAYFTALCAELAAGEGDWLDALVERLPDTDDDCSLVLLTFPGTAAVGTA